MIKPEVCHPGWKLRVSGIIQDNLVNTEDAPEFTCCHPVSSDAGQENNAHLCLRFSKGIHALLFLCISSHRIGVIGCILSVTYFISWNNNYEDFPIQLIFLFVVCKPFITYPDRLIRKTVHTKVTE